MTTCRNEALAAKRFPVSSPWRSDSCFLQSDFQCLHVVYSETIFSAFLRRSVTKTRYLYECPRTCRLYLLFSFLYRATTNRGTFPIRGVDTKTPRHHRVFDCFHFTFIISAEWEHVFNSHRVMNPILFIALDRLFTIKTRIHPLITYSRKVANG